MNSWKQLLKVSVSDLFVHAAMAINAHHIPGNAVAGFARIRGWWWEARYLATSQAEGE
jgi:hypothetical protein